MANESIKIWKKAVVFHLENLMHLVPIFPVLFIPIVSDAMYSLLISQQNKNKSISPGQALQKVWRFLPPLFSMKFSFECAAIFWGVIPIYGIIKGIEYRLYWAMASNVLVFEGLSGEVGRNRCQELIQDSSRGIGIRTLVTVPALLITCLIIVWMIAGSVLEKSYSYGLWFLLISVLFVSIPLSAAVNTFFYLTIKKDKTHSIKLCPVCKAYQAADKLKCLNCGHNFTD